MIRAAVIGVSGYTGEELLKLLFNHPEVKVKHVVGDTTASVRLADLYPVLCKTTDLVVQKFDDLKFDRLDVVFFCLPHTKSQSFMRSIPSGVKVIDLSADFRLSVELYERWYGKHCAPELQEGFIYGLPEFNRRSIVEANNVACPGCYPTSVLIPLIPLVSAGAIDINNIIIDSKSGISGAGKAPSPVNIYCNIAENVIPYNLSCHRHIPEIEMVLSSVSDMGEVKVEFVPSIVSSIRGIISTMYLRSEFDIDRIRSIINKYYDSSLFVELVDYIPTFKSVVGSNYLRCAVYPGRLEGSILIVSAIDNILKGASGQAVQNMNLMFGFDEGMALE